MSRTVTAMLSAVLMISCASLGWSRNFSDSEATKWKEAGFNDPKTATKWREAGFSPLNAREWIDGGFSESVGAKDARAWNERGFSPSQVHEFQQTRCGRDALATYLRARFPADGIIEWCRAGVVNPSHSTLHQWMSTSIPPSQAIYWQEARFEPSEADSWSRAGFEVESAQLWRRVDFGLQGFSFKPDDARRWRDAGVSPNDAAPWQYHGYAIEEALVWQSSGFSFDQTYEWTGFESTEAAAWRDHGFESAAEATPWKDAGFDQTAAKELREAGLTPKGSRTCDLNSKGLTGVVQEFAGAGIAKDGFAEYCNAGYGLEQAKVLEKACGGEFGKQTEVATANPYELEGRCYAFIGINFQLLGRSEALFRHRLGTLVHMDFGKDVAPKGQWAGIVKGQKPYSYTSAAGVKQIVPGLRAVTSSQ